MMTLIRGDALDSQTPARTRVLCIASQMLCLVNLVYAGRFGVNLCGVDARLLVRSCLRKGARTVAS